MFILIASYWSSSHNNQEIKINIPRLQARNKTTTSICRWYEFTLKIPKLQKCDNKLVFKSAIFKDTSNCIWKIQLKGKPILV